MRSTREVFEDHLHQGRYGDVETDLDRNYAADVVLLTSFGVFHGHDGLREANKLLNEHLPNARFNYQTHLLHGEIAFLEWTAESEQTRVDDGADTFHIRGGRIRVQTIHYTLESKS